MSLIVRYLAQFSSALSSLAAVRRQHLKDVQHLAKRLRLAKGFINSKPKVSVSTLNHCPKIKSTPPLRTMEQT